MSIGEAPREKDCSETRQWFGQIRIASVLETYVDDNLALPSIEMKPFLS